MSRLSGMGELAVPSGRTMGAGERASVGNCARNGTVHRRPLTHRRVHWTNVFRSGDDQLTARFTLPKAPHIQDEGEMPRLGDRPIGPREVF